MDLRFGSKFTRQKVGVGVNIWSEFVGEEKKSVHELYVCRDVASIKSKTTMGLGVE